MDWQAWSGAALYALERDIDGDFGPAGRSHITYMAPGEHSYALARQGLADLLHQTYRVRPCLDLARTDCVTTPDVMLSGNLATSIERIPDMGATRFDAISAMALARSVNFPNLLVLAVGLPNANADVGQVRLFTRTDTGAWGLWRTLTKPQGVMGDKFGQSVALSSDGRWLAVGVPGDDQVPNTSPADAHKSGAVYIYALFGTTGPSTMDGPILNATVHAPNPGRDDAFGSAVALDDLGANLMVGAPYEDSAAAGAFLPADATAQYPNATGSYDHRDYGAVYAFKRSTTEPISWTFDRYVKPSITYSGTTSDLRKEGYFGWSLAISGDHVAIGSPGSSRGAAYAGAVQVLAWNPWAFSYEHFSTDAQNSGPSKRRFGASVAYAASGTRLAIGDPGATVDGQLGAGLAHVFSRSGSTWTQPTTRRAPHPTQNAFFGSAVALAGASSDRLLVGAPGDSSALGGLHRFADVQADTSTSRAASGAVFHYQNLSGDWKPKARLKAPTPTVDARLGLSLAVDGPGDFTAVGLEVRDESGGEVFLY